MEVDPIRGARMRLTFDITFPSMPCSVVSIDAMDASGAHQLEVMHNVFKKRLAESGEPIGDSRKHEERGTVKTAGELLKTKEQESAEAAERARLATLEAEGATNVTGEGVGSCGSCWGAGQTAGECCNTCEEVRAAYRKKGWQFIMDNVAQCKREGLVGDLKAQLSDTEGCTIHGHIDAPLVSGQLHFAPGHSMQSAYAHVHDLLSFTVSAFNISHTINELVFEALTPGVADPIPPSKPQPPGPLVGLQRPLPVGTGMHQYYIKLVSQVRVGLDKRTESTYVYSVTEHLRKMDPAARSSENEQGLLPGVFLNFEPAPLRQRVQLLRNSAGHFATRVCAIIGSVFVVSKVVDSGLEAMLKGRGRGLA